MRLAQRVAMRSTEMNEILDLPWFPALFRNLATDALQVLWQFSTLYDPIVPRLYSAIAAVSTSRPGDIVDLCSGGGGPWLHISQQLESTYGLPVNVCLTDKFPNYEAFTHVHLQKKNSPCSRNRFTFIPDSIDAVHIPPELQGFRCMFSSFHHFRPSEAVSIFRNAIENGYGIGIFELANRNPKTLLSLCFIPFLILLLTPFIRPFRCSRLLWTYVIPMIPFVIFIDGIISCLRAYDLPELHEIVEQAKQTSSPSHYEWQIGEDRNGLLPVTYIIGHPVSVSSEEVP